MMPIRSMITRAAIAVALATGATVLGAAPASAAPNTWAAIAISVETGSIGYAWEQPSGAAAARAAVAGCDASDWQAKNLAWGWAYAASLEEAEREAIRSTPGKGARVLAHACSGAHR